MIRLVPARPLTLEEKKKKNPVSNKKQKHQESWDELPSAVEVNAEKKQMKLFVVVVQTS